ncbi:BACON domain-containing protein [Prevotella sp. E13-27]|uniref:BACON domain-containing protein n=1 Tax=Prevotella sp. E13-27 TaxID=2938122 RepID=UPI002009E1B3|nr:BACON domain-containing protein [Prevotella sp. E13-27]MCK8621049.1 BACON domain-containing protein [Prevotella sp. E13-27]
MKEIKNIQLLLFSLLILLVGCNDDLADKEYYVNHNYFSIGSGVIIFSDDVDNVIVSVDSKGSWNIANIPNWIDVSPKSGKGTGSFSVSATKNPLSTESRSDTIYVHHDGLTSLLQVKQAPSDYKFVYTPTQLDFGSNETEKKLVTLDNNTTWTASNTKGWCHVSPTSGKGTTELQVYCDVNSTNAERKDVITIKTAKGESYEIPVAQSGTKYYLKTSPEKLEKFKREGGKQDIQLLSNTDWIITSSDSWCKLSQNRGQGDYLITVFVDKNTLTTQRSTTLSITWDQEEKIIEVTQERGEEPRLSFSPQIIEPFPYQGGIYTIEVSSNTDWTVESNQEWCHIDSPTETITGDGNIKIIVDENPLGSAQRDAILTIKSNAGDKQIYVHQEKGLDPFIDVSSDQLSFSNKKEQKTITIISNVDWTVVCTDDSWCHIETPQGAGAGTKEIRIRVDVNPAEASERNCTLSIKSSWLEDKKIVVHQAKGDAGYVRTTPSNLNAQPQGGTVTFGIDSNLSNWTVSSDQSWCSVQTTSGSFNRTVSLYVQLNACTDARDATITIKSAISDVTVTVHQEPKDVPGDDNPNPKYTRKR